jgi:5-methylphenazine-1-carboxylate 1-monooxygenase
MPAMIERTREIFEFPLIDRDPVDAWTSGRVTLIGDAAHPMQPIGSQAGTQAIIDARVLTQMLLSSPNPRDGLQHYDLQRRPVMNDIILRNRRFGPELAMQLVEERAPDGFDRIENVISNEELETTTKSYSVAAGLDVETVNRRPPRVKPISLAK